MMSDAGQSGPYWGKYRGQIAGNIDPLSLGRIQVTCPAVLGSGRSSWAMPSTPFAGAGVGLFLIPPVGTDIWVEFEGGDPDHPIWAGCFWSRSSDVPAQPAIAETKVLKTDGLTLTINDLPGGGGVTLQVAPPVVSTPLTISLTSSGIELTNGAASVKITPATVSVNDGALEVI
jgi:Type VI secretion system/phage-baseplate injector OB domain